MGFRVGPFKGGLGFKDRDLRIFYCGPESLRMVGSLGRGVLHGFGTL